jgi:hypothetical protein
LDDKEKTDGPNGNKKSAQEIATELFDVHQMQVAFYNQYFIQYTVSLHKFSMSIHVTTIFASGSVKLVHFFIAISYGLFGIHCVVLFH